MISARALIISGCEMPCGRFEQRKVRGGIGTLGCAQAADVVGGLPARVLITLSTGLSCEL